jgi:hypothetical protein
VEEEEKGGWVGKEEWFEEFEKSNGEKRKKAKKGSKEINEGAKRERLRRYIWQGEESARDYTMWATSKDKKRKVGVLLLF